MTAARASLRAALAALLVVICGTGMHAAFAIDTEEDFADAGMQDRYDRMINELRCLMCQNQSIADSPVGLAADLRREVRRMLLEGKSDAQIRTFMTDRYGDFVLYRPPLNPRTALLWALPFLLLLGGGAIAYRVVSQRARLVATDPDEPERLDRT